MHELFDRFKEDMAAESRPEKSTWSVEASYSKCFASAVDKARTRLPDEFCPAALAARPSQCWPWLRNTTPWLQAQVDTYNEIVIGLKAKGEAADPDALMVCDVSQSCNRGAVSGTGLWGTVCTSTRFVQLGEGGCMLGAPAHLCLLGFDVDEVTLRGLTSSDVRELAGNAMSFTQCSQVLLPLLKEIGCL